MSVSHGAARKASGGVVVPPTPPQRDNLVENFAAELTSAAYPLVLRHGNCFVQGWWIKVELGLWRALAESVKKWARECPPAGPRYEFETSLEGLLVDLTERAFFVAVKHGIKGSFLEVKLGLYRAFRLVIRRRCGAGLPE
jgi:hypothetical protein